MFDPLAEMKAALFLAIRIAIAREEAAVVLSRLSTMDVSRPQDYLDAIKTIA